MGGKGQVALYVLIGVILVVGVVLALYLFNQKEIETSTGSIPAELFNDNPECRADVLRMQERADDCLETTLSQVVADYEDEGWLPESFSEMKEYLAEELAIEFPACFQEWPINDRLLIVGDEPRVELTVGSEQINAQVTFAVAGECDEQSYQLTSYSALVKSDTLPRWERADEARGEALENAGKLFDTDCGFDPYGLQEQELYADALFLEDGRRIVYLYDYTGYDGSEEPTPVEIELPPCEGGLEI